MTKEFLQAAGLALLFAPLAVLAADKPPPLPPVRAAVEIGTLQQNANVLCRDGSYSALIGGRPVWTFGDTCLAHGGAAGDTFIDNSLAWGDSLDASDGIALNHDRADAHGVPRRFLPLTEREIAFNAEHAPDEIALWPGPLVPDPQRRRVLAFFVSVYRGAGIGFDPVGSGIAVASPDLKTVTRPLQNPDPDAREPSYMWPNGERAYTNGAVVVGEMLYAYAGEARFLRTAVHVARVRLADALDKSRWRYYAGDGQWSADLTRSQSIYDGGAAGDTIFFSPYLGAYVTLYQPFLSNDVQYRVAWRPEGPWSRPALAFTARQGTEVSYAARVHPQYAQNAGQVQFVSYVMNTGFLRQQQQLVKLTFGPLGAR